MEFLAKCDPAIEQCGESDTLIRPSMTDLVQLTTVYYANIAFLMPSLVFWGIYRLENHPTNDMVTLWDVFAYVVMWFFFTGYHILVWLFPALTLTFYMLTSADFFLFRWTDNLGLYFVTQGVAQQGFNCHALVSIVALLLWISEIRRGEDAGFERTIFLAYTLPAGLLEYLAWRNGVNAARRIDPTWTEHRGLLYPPSFYRRGWVEDEPYPEPEAAVEDVTSIVTL